MNWFPYHQHQHHQLSHRTPQTKQWPIFLAFLGRFGAQCPVSAAFVLLLLFWGRGGGGLSRLLLSPPAALPSAGSALPSPAALSRRVRARVPAVGLRGFVLRLRRRRGGFASGRGVCLGGGRGRWGGGMRWPWGLGGRGVCAIVLLVGVVVVAVAGLTWDFGRRERGDGLSERGDISTLARSNVGGSENPNHYLMSSPKAIPTLENEPE